MQHHFLFILSSSIRRRMLAVIAFTVLMSALDSRAGLVISLIARNMSSEAGVITDPSRGTGNFDLHGDYFTSLSPNPLMYSASYTPPAGPAKTATSYQSVQVTYAADGTVVIKLKESISNSAIDPLNPTTSYANAFDTCYLDLMLDSLYNVSVSGSLTRNYPAPPEDGRTDLTFGGVPLDWNEEFHAVETGNLVYYRFQPLVPGRYQLSANFQGYGTNTAGSASVDSTWTFTPVTPFPEPGVAGLAFLGMGLLLRHVR